MPHHCDTTPSPQPTRLAVPLPPDPPESEMAFKGPLAVAPALLWRCTSCCSRSLKTAYRPLVMLVNMSEPGCLGCFSPKLVARTRSRGLGPPVPSLRCSDYPDSRHSDQVNRIEQRSTPPLGVRPAADSGYPPDGLTSVGGSVWVGVGGGSGGGSGRSGCRWIGAPCSFRWRSSVRGDMCVVGGLGGGGGGGCPCLVVKPLGVVFRGFRVGSGVVGRGFGF